MKFGISISGLALCLAALTTSGLVATPVFAQVYSTFDTGRNSIDMSSRQPMLSQGIPKSICFIELSNSVDMHQDYLEADNLLSDSTPHVLHVSTSVTGIVSSERPHLLEEMNIAVQVPMVVTVEQKQPTDNLPIGMSTV